MTKVVTFRFRRPEAQSVVLLGDFNNWNESAHPMAFHAPTGEWNLAIPLKPGRYEYKFLVDGMDWWNDPNAPTVPNVWGSENSYIDV